MSNKNQGGAPGAPEVNLGALVAAQSTPENEFQALQLELLRQQVADNRVAREARATADNQRKAIRDETVRWYKKVESEHQAAQAHCSHKKDNGSTHLAGQYTHRGSLILICQGCGKLFDNDEAIRTVGLSGLMPPQEFIGGPNRTAA